MDLHRKLEGKDVPTGSTKMKTASGEEVKADRGKFVQVSTHLSSLIITILTLGIKRQDRSQQEIRNLPPIYVLCFK